MAEQKDINKASQKNVKKQRQRGGKTGINSLIYIVFSALIVFIIYFACGLNTGIDAIVSGNMPDETYISAFMKHASKLVAILGFIFAFIMLYDVFTGEPLKPLKTVAAVLTLGLPIIGATMLAIYNLPLLLRAFENTFGYGLCKSDLQGPTQALFGNADANYQDYSIVATQLFKENFVPYLTSMTKDSVNSLNRFKNVYLNPSFIDANSHKLVFKDDKGAYNPVHQLLEQIMKKRQISETVWLSLAAILTMYAASL